MSKEMKLTSLIIFWQAVQDRVRTLISQSMNDKLEDTIITLQEYRDTLS